MTRHVPPPPPGDPAQAAQQLAQLGEILTLVETIAGRAGQKGDALDRAARVAAAYDAARPVTRRRFDALAAETAGWAASGVEALLASEARHRTAADRLADALARAERDLLRLLGIG